MKRNRLLGVISTTLGILMVLLTAFTVDPKIRIAGDPGARMFPFMTGGLFIVTGLALLFRKDDTKDEVFLTPRQWFRLFRLFGVLILYVIIMYVAGFIAATFVLLLGVSLMFAWGQGTKPVEHLIFALVATAVIYFLFHNGLKIYLPKGMILG